MPLQAPVVRSNAAEYNRLIANVLIAWHTMHHDWTVAFCIGTAVVSTSLLFFQNWYLRRRFLSASAKVVPPPHPQWSPGEAQPCPYASGVRSIDPEEITGAQCYPLVISGVVPRPIAFVSTLSAEGNGNLSPFSYFNALSHDPPCIAVSICRSGQRGGNMKDSAKNIQDTKYVCISQLTTSIDFPSQS